MPLPPIWAFLFFTMLITLGLDSQFTMVETITTAVMDQWPQTRVHKGKVVIGASVLGFLLGLSCTTHGGIYMFSLIDSYASSWGLLICALTEVILVMYVYGFRRFFDNIEEMGIRIPMVLKYYWISMWTVVTPLILGIILIMTFVQYSPASSLSYGDTYVFPGKIQAMGWLMALCPAFIIITGGIFSWWNRGRSGRDNGFKAMITPNDKWCSAVDDANKNRAGVTNVSYVVDGDTIKY